MKSKFESLCKDIKFKLLTEHKSKEFNDIEVEEEIIDNTGKIWNIYAKADVNCEITYNEGERESFDNTGESGGWELTENPVFSNLQIIDNNTDTLITIENTDPDIYNSIKSKIEDAIMNKVSKQIDELDPEEEYFNEPDFDYDV